jgi:hypothetical protein
MMSHRLPELLACLREKLTMAFIKSSTPKA